MNREKEKKEMLFLIVATLIVVAIGWWLLSKPKIELGWFCASPITDRHNDTERRYK